MNHFRLTLFGSALVALSFFFPSVLWFLAPIGLGCFFYDLWFKTKTLGGAFVRGAIFGFINAGASIFWFWATLPITWLSGDPLTQFLSVGIIWGLISFMLGLGTVFIAPVLFHLRKVPFAPLIFPVSTAALWAFQEYMRMLLYGFITYGGESLPGAHFSVSALGYAFAENNYLLKFAEVQGVYSLSFAVAFVAASGAVLWHFALLRQRKDYTIVGLLTIIFLLSPLAFSIFKAPNIPNAEPLTFAIVTLDGSENSEGVDAMQALQSEIEKSNTDIVLFPESATPPWLMDNEARAKFTEARSNRETLLIYSHYAIDPGAISRAELIYERIPSGERTVYNKRFLMPLGEYIPSFTKTAFASLDNAKLKRQIDNLSSLLKRGEVEAQAITFKGTTIGGLLCSENLSPELYAGLSHQGATVLVNLSNITWFHNNPSVMHMLLTLSKVHAVEYHAYFVVAMKGGYSFVLSPEGKIIAQSDYAKNGILVQTIYP